ncbi:domain of Kin17 curved DNA-binding protein-domain-containing protein [Hyaloraphidium curvatum]|nr:domain of Kin17 curved DNA-binding protein-domain-containing protein [Hyaloraphidium curvatum]
MGKEMTPKEIGKMIKAKGLQKLRWYCQMCEKQCRDENGFKCHCASEAHQRQMMLFAENSRKYMDTFSTQFKDEFLKLLSRRFGTRRVMANLVYQEYISDRHHVHMNATQWSSLTEFVKWMGKEGICEVEDTEKGWFIKWVDRRPETLARKEAELRKARSDRDDEERQAKLLEEQIERAKAQAVEVETTATELVRTNEDEKVKVELKPAFSMKPLAAPKKLNALAMASKKSAPPAPSTEALGIGNGTKKLSAVEAIILEEQARKDRAGKMESRESRTGAGPPDHAYDRRRDERSGDRRSRSRSPVGRSRDDYRDRGERRDFERHRSNERPMERARSRSPAYASG